ncbi:unnamed protein product [Cyclocybe aegerita]|uniref:Uncharacterized protein n=1 Tax=Cyclocybe aegerita TaxID=1973307 RepID=A0A8S0W8G1_CYCAE|nr:unnamed protein product [Cyclocybe aegerita]
MSDAARRQTPKVSDRIGSRTIGTTTLVWVGCGWSGDGSFFLCCSSPPPLHLAPLVVSWTNVFLSPSRSPVRSQLLSILDARRFTSSPSPDSESYTSPSPTSTHLVTRPQLLV